MNYRQCLSYLEQVQTSGMKFGLDNVRAILASLGNPHKAYPSVLVAGSNGKGSVCAMLSRILTLQGFRTGLYTSPHLVRYEERIRIGGDPISAKAFSRVLTRMRSQIERLTGSGKLATPPTHFELLTCAALMFFAEDRVDMAVLEVGMGGRFDATNVVTPELSVITTITEEHQSSLGESLEEIAFEKAGIIKPGVPVVCGVVAREAAQTIRQRAGESGAPLVEVFGPGNSLIAEPSAGGDTFRYEFPDEAYVYSPSLPGLHQGKNAAVALAAARELGRLWQPIEREKILAGIATTSWEGRLESFLDHPPVVMDGAHNLEGAQALREFILERLGPSVILVFATMQDKKIEELARVLFPLAERIILTRYPYYRAATPEEIARRAPGFSDRIELEPDTAEAVRRALAVAGERSAVVITGSLFLVGEVKKLFPNPQAALS
jgi:dihydrofolate synthase/folylpolyglutamate synthase